MHCESGDVLVRDAVLAAPRVGDVLVTPATGAYGYSMASNYNGVAAAAGGLLQRRRGPRRGSPRDLRRPRSPAMPEPARVGLLGHGTVGSAFADALAERADAIAASCGRRPELGGVLRALARATSTRSSRGSEIVVELIGGTEPAREYVLRALREGSHVVTANKQLIAQHGDELFAAAREAGVQLRFEAAVAGVVPVIRVIQESLAGDRDREGLRDRQRHDQLHPLRDGATGARYDDALAPRAGARYAEADPTRGRERRGRRREDGDPRPARVPTRRSGSTR